MFNQGRKRTRDYLQHYLPCLSAINEEDKKSKSCLFAGDRGSFFLHYSLINMSNSCAVIVGDIGGTNGRLELLRYNANPLPARPSVTLVTRQTYRTNSFVGLSAILNRFLDDVSNDQQTEEEILNLLKNKK